MLAICFYIAPETISGLSQYKVANNFLGIGFKESLLFLIFLITFLLPASIIYYLYKVKIIATLQLKDLKSRRLPFFFTFLIYLGFTLFLQKNMPTLKEIIIAMVSITLSIFWVAIISLFWQISAHAVGVSGVLGAIFVILIKKDVAQLFIPLIVLLILVGLVASARLKLNAHTPRQILAGILLGFFISIIFTSLFF